MNMDKRTQDEVEQTMRSIDGIERATLRPFFATRTEARLDRLQAFPKPLGLAFRPVIMVLTMGLIVLLNLLTVNLFQQKLETFESTTITDQFTDDWQSNDPLSW
jgi:hypothetical protein